MSTTEVLEPLRATVPRKALPIYESSRSRNSLELAPSFPPPSDRTNGQQHELEFFFESPGPESPLEKPSTVRIVLCIFQPSMVNFFSSFTTGVITAALPSIAKDIAIPRSLYVWPSSVYSLTSGSMLLIMGSIADLIGPRSVELVSIFLIAIFTIAGAWVKTGVQLVVFRALQGIAIAMHFPASVALVAAGVPEGKARNLGFACLGLSQLTGFSVGLVAAGLLDEGPGWRVAFYISGGGLLCSAVTAFWVLPKVASPLKNTGLKKVARMLWEEVDWVGGLLVGGGLAMLAYVLAILSANLSAFKQPSTSTLFAFSLAFLMAFPVWMDSRTKLGKPALIPNALWKKLPFTITCIMITLSFGVLNSMELFSSLFFQEVQGKKPITGSLYLLPNLVVGTVLCLSMGLFVDRVPARWLAGVSSFICALAPLFMAVVPPEWIYWRLEFGAQVFAPISAGVLFTLGLIVVSSNFPPETQALAGAVFNTVTQFGQSFGIGLCQVVALGVMGQVGEGNEGESAVHGGAFGNVSPENELKGYRAAFWTMFAFMMTCGFLGLFGLRAAGKVGLKRE